MRHAYRFEATYTFTHANGGDLLATCESLPDQSETQLQEHATRIHRVLSIRHLRKSRLVHSFLMITGNGSPRNDTEANYPALDVQTNSTSTDSSRLSRRTTASGLRSARRPNKTPAVDMLSYCSPCNIHVNYM